MSVAVSYSFSPTTTIGSAQVNQNFTDLVNYINNTACATGMVTMWAGAIGSIPTGWQLCNGSSGSPDLRDRFIVGAGTTYSIGNTGGEAAVTLTAAQSGLPAHAHGVTDPGHYHRFWYDNNSGSTATAFDNDENSKGATNESAVNTETKTTGVTIDNNSAAAASSSHENRPPYYALAFIYKT